MPDGHGTRAGPDLCNQRSGRARALASGGLMLALALGMVAPAQALASAATPESRVEKDLAGAQKVKGKADKAASDDDDDDDDSDDHDKDDDDDASSMAPPDSWPTTYIDLETGWTSTPGNTIGFNLRRLQSLTGSKSRGLYMSAPLTIDITDGISVYAGPDGSASQTLGDKWSKFTPGSWTVGGSAEMIEQSGAVPGVTLSTSVSRPFQPIALGATTTSLSIGVDLDYALNKDETRGLTAGLTFTRTLLSASRGRVGPQFDGYIGAYWSPSNQVNLTSQVGVQYFGGADVASIIRIEPVTTPYIKLEIEHVDADDNRVFAVDLMLGWSPKPTIQLSLSTPLYLAH